MSDITWYEISVASIACLLSIIGVIVGRAYSLIYKKHLYPENTCFRQMTGALIPNIIVSIYMWNYYYLVASVIPLILATHS